MPDHQGEVKVSSDDSSTGNTPVLRGPMLRIGLHGLEKLREHWGRILAVGIALVVLGTIALGMSVVTTIASMVFIGCLMVAGGLIESWLAFQVKEWGGFFLSLLMGILYVVGGAVFIANPGAAAIALTLMVAMFLIFGGIFRIVFALMERFPHWGWLVFHGVINLVLGIMIWRRWPSSGLWVIGLFVAIDMILNGWSLVMLSLAAKNLPERKHHPAEVGTSQRL